MVSFLHRGHDFTERKLRHRTVGGRKHISAADCVSMCLADGRFAILFQLLLQA